MSNFCFDFLQSYESIIIIVGTHTYIIYVDMMNNSMNARTQSLIVSNRWYDVLCMPEINTFIFILMIQSNVFDDTPTIQLEICSKPAFCVHLNIRYTVSTSIKVICCNFIIDRIQYLYGCRSWIWISNLYMKQIRILYAEYSIIVTLH